MKPFASRREPIFRSRFSTSRWRANRTSARCRRLVAKIEAARASGVDVTADTYAYPAWFNGLSAFIPPWAHDGGDARLIERLRDPQHALGSARRWRRPAAIGTTSGRDHWPKDILIGAVQNPSLLALQGKTLAEVALLWKENPVDAVFDLIIKDRACTGVAVFASIRTGYHACLAAALGLDRQRFLRAHRPMACWEGNILIPRLRHFSRILRKYVREEAKLSLPDAIRKFSALAAQRMGLVDRGVLKEDMWADIVVFAPDQVRDVATFENPKPALPGNELCIGERRSGHRRRKGYRRPPGQSAARSWILMSQPVAH